MPETVVSDLDLYSAFFAPSAPQMAVSPDENFLSVNPGDWKRLYLWDVGNECLRRILPAPPACFLKWLGQPEFDENRKDVRFFINAGHGRLAQCNTATAEARELLAAPEEHVAMHISPDNRFVACVRPVRHKDIPVSIHILEISTGICRQTLAVSFKDAYVTELVLQP